MWVSKSASVPQKDFAVKFLGLITILHFRTPRHFKQNSFGFTLGIFRTMRYFNLPFEACFRISWRIVAAEKTIERVKWCSIYIAEDNNEPGLHEKVSVESELMSFTFHDLNLSHSYRCFVKVCHKILPICTKGWFKVVAF